MFDEGDVESIIAIVKGFNAEVGSSTTSPDGTGLERAGARELFSPWRSSKTVYLLDRPTKTIFSYRCFLCVLVALSSQDPVTDFVQCKVFEQL